MDYIRSRFGETSTYIGIGLFALISGGVDLFALSSISWNEALGMLASLAAVLLREAR